MVEKSPVVAGAVDDFDAHDRLPDLWHDDDEDFDKLIEEEIPEDLDAFTLQTLTAYIGGGSEYDAYRLAQRLSEEELGALVDKCAQNPTGMLARVENRKRKRHDDADTFRALEAASGSSFATRWPCPVYLRLAIGENILEWQKNIGHTGRGWATKYWETAHAAARERKARWGSGPRAVDKSEPRGSGSSASTSGGGRRISERERRFLTRCRQLAEKSSATSTTVAKSYKRARTSVKLGRPHKAPTLRDTLFQWFCSIRGSVKGRLPLSALRFQAERLRTLYIATAAKLMRPVSVPKITVKWLRLFRQEKHISLRLPNKRWKVPRHVFMERNTITWSNNLAMRKWIALATGEEPECVDNVDQKPFHVNESGSKYQKTLAFAGREVELVELHSATRERWTCNTFGTSDEDRAMNSDVWLEMLMKGGPEVLRKLREGLEELRASGSLGRLTGVSVATSPSGSYDTHDFLEYLRRSLPEWGPGRRWRILLLDAFTARQDERNARLCWNRGYLCVYIGGGCTGALQPLDTHLHALLSKLYQEMEMNLLMRISQENDTRVPVLDRTTMMSILTSVWQRSRLHLATARGFRDNMFTLALDGSEDYRGSEECRKYWSECDMDNMRKQVLRDVEDAWAAGELPLTFESYQSLLKKFPPKGSMDVIEPGYEDEGSVVQDGEVMWDDHADSLSPPLASDEEDDGETGEAPDAAVAEICADPDVCRQVHLYQEDLNRYDRMAEEARVGNDNKILVAIEKARRAVAQQACGKGAEDALIADAMIKVRDREDMERSQQRAAVQRRKAEMKSLEVSRARAAEEQERLCEGRARLRLMAEAQAREQASLDAARAFDTQDFVDKVGQREKAFKNRWVAMQRVLLLCKALSPAAIKSMARDWAKWDSTNRNDGLHYPSPESYAIQYKNWIKMLLAHLAAGRNVEVERWWTKQMNAKVPPADVLLPALPSELLTSATCLVGAPPAPATDPDHTEPRGSGSSG